MNKDNTPPKEEIASVSGYGWELLFVVAGLVLFYIRYEPLVGATGTENFLGYIGSLFGAGLLGSLIVGMVPYLLLKNRTENAALKAFSVAFFLVGLLMVASR